jgi:integrase
MQGNIKEIPLFKYIRQPRKFKDFLYHINKGKLVKNSLFKLKEPKKIPQTLTKEQVIKLINACHSIRDKFLIQLLYESGMRIGQAISLRHQDISTWDNEIKVVPRFDNVNKARPKSKQANSLTVSRELMQLYTDYLVNELDDIISDYVFVTLKNKVGKPLTYNAVMSIFRSLKKRTGIDIVTPHKFRHTHATELIKDGMGMEWVQKRLGHQSVQTTIDIYSHLEVEDLRPHLETFFERNQDN